ncbi:sensor domain-containing protein [Shewanella holmiensis]|uniref:PAS domain S-box protein n=1 Tax=Shewanella holmiensis TaxID=2952222 RepID=A0A9X2WLX5_9GAMM|nr:GGDEF and EAL domain-containing protein [Shewanella holmiensis]MCT7941594.1 PAS domain S-box protein [Shewanella holmiensis]
MKIETSQFITSMSYWVLTILWLVIVGIYLQKIKQLKAIKGVLGGTITVLLMILTIDAIRTIIESVYFGLYFNSMYGLLPNSIHELLSQPNLLILPKTINIAAGLLVIWLLINHWIPRELREREESLRILNEAKISSLNNEKLFTSIFNCVSDGCVFVDPQGCIISINQGLEKLLGYRKQELVGQNVLIIYASNEEYEQHGHRYFNPEAEETLESCEANYKRKDGSIVIAETSRVIIKDVDNKIQGYMGLFRDITERKNIAFKLQASKQKLTHHIQNTLLGYICWDKNSNCIDMNKSAEKIFGYSLEEVKGNSLLDLLVPEDIRVNIKTNCQSQFKSNKTSVSINKNLTKDGRTIICEWHNTPDLDTEGNVVGMTSLIQDVTENRLNQIALHEAEKKFREQSQRYAEVLWAANLGTWEWNIHTGDFVLNERWCEMLGFTLEELKPITIDTWKNLLHPDDTLKTNELVHLCFINEIETYESEFRMRHKDGHWVWILDRGRVVEWTIDGEPVRMSGTHQDITAKKKADEDVKLAASVFTYAKEGIIITDSSGTIIDANEAFTTVTGYTFDEVINQHPRILQSGRHTSKFYKNMWTTLHEKGFWTGEIWNKRKNGDIYPEMLTISAVIDSLGKVKNYIGLFNDISAIKEYQTRLERIAHFDTLTNLPNRTLLADRLTQSMSRCQRQKTLIGVAFLDLDKFKIVNDTHGHDVGDQLLILISTRMKKALRDEDTLARIGGDEFVVIMENITTVSDCEPILNRLLEAASEAVVINGIKLEVSTSIGVSIYPKDGLDADQLIRNADQAMYIAKQHGKNRFHLFDNEQNIAIVLKHEKLKQIRHALDQSKFRLFYQPKVNMQTGNIIGVEALIRWQSSERGIIGPNEFLPLIENNELIIEIGEWVIKTALQQIKVWKTMGLNIPVSVNISALQLQSNDFPARLSALLSQFPEVPPTDLELEVLETSALGDLLKISETMQNCIKLGVNFALDDFGTGYSSLSYLRRLPASVIKIDQTFVRDMLIDPEDLAIIESVVLLAKSFKRDVIAEGVETIDHGIALLELGCVFAQGYAIAKPMPAEEIPHWIESWQPEVSWQQYSNKN